MSWFKGFLVVCCTASLVIAGDGESDSQCTLDVGHAAVELADL
jgi:hypothetical protein